jgi:hypothetical protein
VEPILAIIAYINIGAIYIAPAIARIGVEYTDSTGAQHLTLTYPDYRLTVYIICMLLSVVGLQTCIVLIRTPHFILAGADSKIAPVILSRDDHGHISESGTTARSICKIRRVNTFFFASSGISKVSSPAFDIDSLAEQACKESTTIEQLATDVFPRLVSGPLANILGRWRTDLPAHYERKAVRSDILQIAFFAMGENSPTFCYLRFRAKNLTDTTSQLNISLMTCPGSVSDDHSFVQAIGQCTASARYLSDEHLLRSNPIGLIKKAIQAEAAAKPDIVGLPIDILRIDKDGARWIQVKRGCGKL